MKDYEGCRRKAASRQVTHRNELRLHVVQAQTLHMPHVVRELHEARLHVVARERVLVHEEARHRGGPGLRVDGPRHDLARLQAVHRAPRVGEAVHHHEVDDVPLLLSDGWMRFDRVEDVAQEGLHVVAHAGPHGALGHRLGRLVDPEVLHREVEVVREDDGHGHLFRSPPCQRDVFHVRAPGFGLGDARVDRVVERLCTAIQRQRKAESWQCHHGNDVSAGMTLHASQCCGFELLLAFRIAHADE